MRAVLASLLLLACLAPLASAGDAPPQAGGKAAPAPEKAAAVRETWVYQRDGVTQRMDVTGMSAEQRDAAHRKLLAAGWRQTGRQTEAAAAATPDGGISEALRKDLRELVRRGGVLPPGFRPNVGRNGRPGQAPPAPAPADEAPADKAPADPAPDGQAESAVPGLPPAALEAVGRAVGTLLLQYLEAKDDPVAGPVYESLVRDVAEALKNGAGTQPRQLVARLMARFMAGMQDPETAPVYRKILATLGGVLMSGARPPGAGTPGAHPPARLPRFPDAPRLGPLFRAPGGPAASLPWAGLPGELGGARVVYRLIAGPGSGLEAWVGPVPSGSTAAAAGLHEGDRITAIDGAPVTPAALQKAAKAFHTGGQLTLGLRRKDGQTETLEIEFEVEEQGAATK